MYSRGLTIREGGLYVVMTTNSIDIYGHMLQYFAWVGLIEQS